MEQRRETQRLLERLLKEQRAAFEEELSSLRGNRQEAARCEEELDEALEKERHATAAAQRECRERERRCRAINRRRASSSRYLKRRNRYS